MKQFWAKAYCVFMIIATLNTSVDIPDYLLYGKQAKGKIGKVNEMESIAELFAESITDVDFDESANDDADGNSTAKKRADNKLYQIGKPTTVKYTAATKGIADYLEDTRLLPSFMGEVTSPPPKA